MHAIHMQLHNAVRNFSRASARVDDARDELERAEGEGTPVSGRKVRLPSGEQEEILDDTSVKQVDLAHSETLATAVVQLQEATSERDRLHQIHKQKITDFDNARKEVDRLKTKYR